MTLKEFIALVRTLESNLNTDLSVIDVFFKVIANITQTWTSKKCKELIRTL